MQDYDIKRGHFKKLEKGGLEKMMKDMFGNVDVKGDTFKSSYGAIEEIIVLLKDKSAIGVETKMRTDVDNDIASETIRIYNDFLFEATGFTSKERKKRLNEKLKKGLR